MVTPALTSYAEITLIVSLSLYNPVTFYLRVWKPKALKASGEVCEAPRSLERVINATMEILLLGFAWGDSGNIWHRVQPTWHVRLVTLHDLTSLLVLNFAFKPYTMTNVNITPAVDM